MTELLRTDLTSFEIGPYSSQLPAPMKLKLALDGEVIVSAEVETGYLHRGLEKTFELHLWQAAMAYADRLDPEGSAFGELALALAVEDIANVQVPERAQAIRVVLTELSRVSAHMGYVVRMARAVGAETMVHYVLRDRERILDLFELLTGARFTINFIRFGGVRADVTEGFIERVLEVCELIRLRLKEYNDLFTFNHAFLLRTSGVGAVSPQTVLRYGMSGPNARAAGVPFDVRKAYPHTGYDRLDFAVPVGRGEAGLVGDAHDRFLLRLREIAQSIEVMKQVAEGMPLGEFQNGVVGDDFAVPAGEAYSRIESARGLLGCHVVADGGRYPGRVQFRVPSLAQMAALPELLAGVRLEDLPVLVASLDLGVAEADR